MVGVTGNPGQANYAAAKAGMIGMSKALAAGGRLARHHRQLRRAGLHRHGHDREPDEEQQPAAARRHPDGPHGSAGGDCRAAWSFWRATRRGYVTGQTLHVNGGMAMI